jgi:hypothetical protein
MIGFSETSRWSINRALFGREGAEKLATESFSKIKAKFVDIEESFKNFSDLSFNDKIDLCYYFLDRPGLKEEYFSKIKGFLTPEAKKFLIKCSNSSDNLRNLGSMISKNGDTLKLTDWQEYNKITIEEKISDCICLLYGSDLFEMITQVIINKDKEHFAEFYELLEITSSVMEQKQSFEVEKDVYKMWIATQRDKKLENLLSDI